MEGASRLRLSGAFVPVYVGLENYLFFDLPFDPAASESWLFPCCDFLALLLLLRDIHFCPPLSMLEYYKIMSRIYLKYSKLL
jgi:hypothetical protein